MENLAYCVWTKNDWFSLPLRSIPVHRFNPNSFVKSLSEILLEGENKFGLSFLLVPCTGGFSSR